MYQCKLINRGGEEEFEKDLNSFLGQIAEGKLVDVKYNFETESDNGVYGSDAYSALVIYYK